MLNRCGQANSDRVVAACSRPVAIAALAWHWREHFPRQSIEMPGAHALVSALSGHRVKIAIISNGAERTRRMTLENLSFKEHIGLLVSSEAACREKPDPGIFLHTARQLDLSPAQCVQIGDHPLNDVTGAAAAGMRSIWLSGFHPWSRSRSDPLWLRFAAFV